MHNHEVYAVKMPHTMPYPAILPQLWASLRWVLQVMYAEPMGSKTPNSRSPQSGMRMDHHTLSDDGEEVLQPSPPVPGTSPPPPPLAHI